MARKILVSIKRPRGDRIHLVSEEDVLVVLARLPTETLVRLRAIHFNDRGRGGRVAGYTTIRGRREITLCAVAPRKSFTNFLHRGQSPRTFGAARGSQWPRLALRRYLLYDVLLHEVGHLQVVLPNSRDPRRHFAGERLAQRFADTWRKRLWATPFDHPDPVHNRPTAEELLQADGASP